MQLEHYISDLLYRYECVIVPGFGAFLTQYQGARVDEDLLVCYPPQKKVSFNAQLTDTDGLLANYIATTDQISHEQANHKISSYVRFLFDNLHHGKTISLHNIGTLYLNNGANLQFDPLDQNNFLTSSFGLTPFTTTSLIRETLKEEVVILEAQTPLTITPEKRSSSNGLKYAAAAVIAFGLLSGLGYYHLKNVKNHNYVSEQEAIQQLDSKIQEATFVIPDPLPAIKLAVSKEIGRYHVVAGAFREEQNASKKVTQLRDRGFKARQIGANKYGLFQVVYGSYLESNEALEALRAARKNDNAAAWLLVEELK